MAVMDIEQIPIADTQAIVELLDATRERYGIRSDEKLAQLLGVSDMAIYRWRRGQIDKSARIMLTLSRQTPPSS
jgi:predicted transcriptional regulator